MAGTRPEKIAKGKAATDPARLDRVRLAKKTLLYALRRGRRVAWLFRDPALANKQVAEDVAAEAMGSLYGGPRRWNPEKVPDVEQHLRSTVNGLLWNLGVSAAQRSGRCSVDGDTVEDGFDPETLLVAKEQEAWEKVLHEKVMEKVLENDELLALYTCVEREGTCKPSVIAQKLGITTREVDNRKRALNRLCAAVCGEMASAQPEKGHG
jgi:DNA-directed RNA polymerase specialized sigma24 family protein